MACGQVRARRPPRRRAAGAGGPEEKVPLFSDIAFDDSGYAVAIAFSAPIADPASLAQIRDSVVGRGGRGIAFLEGKLAGLPPGDPATPSHTDQLHLLIGSLLMYEGRWAEASAHFARAQAADPARPARVPGQHGRLAGGRRPEAGRDRELRGLLQRVELHLPPGPRRRPPPDLRLARGDRALHPLPPAEARGPRGPVAAERRLHDPGGVSRGGPPRVPPAAGPVRPARRTTPGRMVNVANRVGLNVAGRGHGRRVPRRRLRRRRPARRLHRRRPTRRAGRRCCATAATAPSRTAPSRPAWPTRSCP